MNHRLRHRLRHVLVGGILLGLMACYPLPQSYFEGAGPPPEIDVLVGDQIDPSQGDANVGTPTPEPRVGQWGLQPGASAVLVGSHLNDASLSVRLGGRAARVLQILSDGVSGEDRVSLELPPAPVQGGDVELVVATRAGIASAPAAYLYQLPHQSIFADEVASLVLTGDQHGAISGAMHLWPLVSPRGVTALEQSAALYFMPGLVTDSDTGGVAAQWPAGYNLPALPPQNVGTLERARLFPISRPNEAPVSLVRDPLTREVEFCEAAGDAPASWVAGAVYRLELSGGALPIPVVADLTSPPELSGSDGLVSGLNPGPDGVADVDMEKPLSLAPVPGLAEVSSLSASYLVAELVIWVPELSMPGSSYELARLMLRTDDSLPSFTFTPLDMVNLPFVNTSCALLGAELELLRASGGDTQAVETQYLAAGCENLASPLSLYRVRAYVRLARHHIYRVMLPAGAGGCGTPGSCEGSGALLVDLVTRFDQPVNLMRLAPPAPEEDL